MNKDDWYVGGKYRLVNVLPSEYAELFIIGNVYEIIPCGTLAANPDWYGDCGVASDAYFRGEDGNGYRLELKNFEVLESEMDNVVSKEVYVYGRLYTSLGVWDLLEPEPQKKNLPFYLRNDAYRFHVIENFGQGDTDTFVDVKGDFAVILNPQLIIRSIRVFEEDDKQLVPQVSE